MDDAHAEFQKLTAGFLEGDLSPAERERLKTILEKDAALRDELLQEIRINESLKVVAQEAPAGARGERSEFVEAILSQWEKRSVPRNASRAKAPRKNLATPMLIAAGVLIGIAALVFFSLKNQEPREIAGRPAPAPKIAPKPVPPPEKKSETTPPPPKRNETPPNAPEPAPSKSVPPVAPPEKPEPPGAPEPPTPEPEKTKPVPKVTTTVIATLLHVRGDVQILADGAASPARTGQPLTADQSIRTVGRTSQAVLEYPDRTQVELIGETTVTRLVDATKPGKRIFLEQGALSADVSKQPADQPMILTTPHAEARVLGTALLLVVDATSTAIEVDEGRVRFTRSRDGLPIDVNGGFYAIAGPGIELSPRPLQQDSKKKPAGPAKVDPNKVDAAIRKGIASLKAENAKFPYASIDKAQCQDELVLWTLLHGGVPESDPEFSRLLQKMLKDELKYTYRVSLQAMILEQLDRVKHQGRIAQCAQFLVDNQLKHGQWSYGEPSAFANDLQLPREIATPSAPKPKSAADASTPVSQRAKPRVLRKIPITKKKDGSGPGDNSNSQYAALGLRACHDAGILLPKDVIDRARQWWTGAQYNDSKYPREPGGGKGWGYGYTELEWRGSMTAGAAGSLVIYNYILGEDWTKDKMIAGGLEWMSNHFSVSANPEAPASKQPSTHYYYLYGLERLGMLYGTELIGRHEWYVEGAKLLLDAQKADGSWRVANGENAAYDTCFAILFLRRATMPLGDVASTDRLHKR